MGSRTTAGIALGFAIAAGIAFALATSRWSLGAHPGQRIYEDACAACHDVGAHGAPRGGNAEEWARRLATGREDLYKAALRGKTSGDRMMPARGGNPRLTDEQVRAAVDYLVGRSRAGAPPTSR